MLSDVDESLRNLLRRDALNGSGVEVSLDAPTKDWAARRNAPSLSVYLYDVHEAVDRRKSGLQDLRGDDGRVRARRPFPRMFRLSYLVTAWTQRPEDEHRLLTAVLGCLLAHDYLPPEILAGGLADAGVPLELSVAQPPPKDRSISDVWSALGGELKPSLDVGVLAPFVAGTETPVIGIVRETPRLRLADSPSQVSEEVGGAAAAGVAEEDKTGAQGTGAADGARQAGGTRRGGRRSSTRQAQAEVDEGGGTGGAGQAAPVPGAESAGTGDTSGTGSAPAGANRRAVEPLPEEEVHGGADPDRGARRARAGPPAAVTGSLAPPASDLEASLLYVQRRLSLIEARVRRAVGLRRSTDPSPDDPFRGLYLTEEHLDWVLGPSADVRRSLHEPEEAATAADIEADAVAYEAAGGRLRLPELARRVGLGTLEVEVLLVAMIPDLDARFEQLYGYLNDDVSQRRATLGLALELAGGSALSATDRAALGAGGTLLSTGLVELVDEDRPFLGRILRVPDRVTSHLLGDDRPDHRLRLVLSDPPTARADGAGAARALVAGARLVHLRERPGSASRAVAVDALARFGHGALVVDLERLAAQGDPAALVGLARREAVLRDLGVVAGPVETLAGTDPMALSALSELPGPVVLIGRTTWDPRWSTSVPATVDVGEQHADERVRLWASALGMAEDADLGPVPAEFSLAPEGIERAARAARWHAAVLATDIAPEDLAAGARAQNAAGLERLALRISPQVGWDDLVLARSVVGQLRELTARARHRELVLGEWGMRPGGGRGHGVTALFAGDPGTGKTMAAEVLAGSLGLDLYVVNLATVVDKYVGETEKNLERIFTEAEGVNAVVLFDEADALFGKRSEVSDAQDRHANVEVAYLLQRMERFDGLAVLATNLRANVDEAFARRLDALVDFPLPGVAERRLLWDRCIGRATPRGDDLDLDFLARSFELSGGAIRSAVVTAAFLAANAEGVLTMEDLVRATHREYMKLGRLATESEFGRYLAAVNDL